MTTDDSRWLIRQLASRASDDGLAPEVVELLLAIADLDDNEAHARAIYWLTAMGRSIEGVLVRAELAEQGVN